MKKLNWSTFLHSILDIKMISELLETFIFLNAEILFALSGNLVFARPHTNGLF